jgi:hypothetical protein
MRKIIALIIGLYLFGSACIAFVLVNANAKAAVDIKTSLPPQCFTVRIQNPNGSIIWFRFCGTGNAGISPLEEGVSGKGPLQMDGASITAHGCGTRLNPCIVLWPLSPQN